MRVIFLLTFFQCAYASDFSAQVVTGNDYHPFTDEKLPDGGIYTYIVKKILNGMNAKYKIDFLPWARGYELVKKGKYDLTFPYIKTDQRQKEVLYSAQPLMSAHVYLITNLKEKNNNKNSLDEFKGSVFCNPIGYAQEPSIQDKINKKEFSVVREFDELRCLKSLILGKSDIMTATGEYLRQISKDKNVAKGYRKSTEVVFDSQLYVLFSKSIDPKFREEFDKAAQSYLATDEYKKIDEEYK